MKRNVYRRNDDRIKAICLFRFRKNCHRSSTHNSRFIRVLNEYLMMKVGKCNFSSILSSDLFNNFFERVTSIIVELLDFI